MTDDQKTYVIAGTAAAISLVAWLFLVVVPAWKSYWRVRDRLVATVLSVYVLGAFVLAGPASAPPFCGISPTASSRLTF